MNKTAAKSAAGTASTSSKAKAASTAAKKPLAKPAKPAKPPAPVAKPVLKPAPKPALKAAAKPSAKPQPTAKPLPAAKPAPKPAATAKPAPKQAPAAKATPAKAAPPAPAPTKTTATTASRPAKDPMAQATTKPPSAAKVSAAKAAQAKNAPSEAANTVPVLTVPGNRFTDRFAPSRPTARGMPEQREWVKPTVKSDPKLANAWKTKAGRELSVDELFAMPEAEYMNDKQLDFFRVRLQQLKDDLLSNAGETTEHLREDTSIVPDPADRATIEEEHALELRTRDRERKLLKKISQSLTRVEAGDYGFCDETGEPIGLARLVARPTATLSLEAQQRREMKQKMFGE